MFAVAQTSFLYFTFIVFDVNVVPAADMFCFPNVERERDFAGNINIRISH